MTYSATGPVSASDVLNVRSIMAEWAKIIENATEPATLSPATPEVMVQVQAFVEAQISEHGRVDLDALAAEARRLNLIMYPVNQEPVLVEGPMGTITTKVTWNFFQNPNPVSQT